MFQFYFVLKYDNEFFAVLCNVRLICIYFFFMFLFADRNAKAFKERGLRTETNDQAETTSFGQDCVMIKKLMVNKRWREIELGKKLKKRLMQSIRRYLRNYAEVTGVRLCRRQTDARDDSSNQQISRYFLRRFI